ncbi:lysophosphatidic acid receptor 6 [Salminus brasiliensis]|uniref:lysophosphatidic acid receptor 6 n=1 Tax=Salminus brasiliensis TaxID=930266 RepID=UPI003B8370A4
MMNSSNTSQCPEPTADFQFYLLPITYCLVMVFGLLGNLGALYIFFFKIDQKSPSNAYIISLAVADTLFLCALPFRVHYHLNGNIWVFGDVVCRVTGTIFFGNIYISIAFMTCICLDRYIATIHPHTYLQLRNTRWAQMVTTGVWVVTGAATLTFMLTCPLNTDGIQSDGQKGKKCFENFSQKEWESNLMPYSVISLVFGALLPSVIILVCYPLVARRIARIKTATARGALRVIYAILAITVFCFLPYHGVHLLHLLWRIQVIPNCTAGEVIYKVRRVTMALVSMNSLLDPVLYYFATGRCKWNFIRNFQWNVSWLKLKKRRGVYTISDHFQDRWYR